MKTSLWVDRYRPSSLSEVIFQNEKQAQFFRDIVASGNLPNLLLYGVQGTGKSTISKALPVDLGIDSGDVLTIRCSDEKIDALRDKVRGFALTRAFSKFRIVRLEECDRLSLDAQALLRSLIEDSSDNCRFIGTCNYINKVIPALKSRFQEFEFKAPSKDDVVVRMAEVLDNEKITYVPEHLFEYVDLAYPDIRKIIQLLQQNSTSQTLHSPSDMSQQSDWKLELLDKLRNGKFVEARKIVCDTAPKEEHEDVFRFLYENINELYDNTATREEGIVLIAEYLLNHSIVADTEINLAALFIRLSLIK